MSGARLLGKQVNDLQVGVSPSSVAFPLCPNAEVELCDLGAVDISSEVVKETWFTSL
jgi:hypothetical protein